MRQLKITKQVTLRDSKAVTAYLNEVSKIPLITAEEEVELAHRIKTGDQQALDKLVRSNLRFVVSVAKQYQGQGMNLSDLINEGNLGLVKAAQRFDETRGFKFISYAVWWIRQSIISAISNQGRMIRLPSNKIGALKKIYRAYSHLEQTHERPPTAQEIANEIDMNVADVKLSMKNSGRHLSMDAPIKDGETTDRYALTKSKDALKPDESLMQEALQTDLEMVLDELPGRQSDILKMYFGIGNNRATSMGEIGEIFGITRERVRQIKDRAIRNLRRKPSTKAVLQSYLG